MPITAGCAVHRGARVAAETLRVRPAPPAAVTWRPLLQFCLLRVFVAGTFLILGLSGPALRPLGARDLALFNRTAAIYLALAILALLLLRLRWPPFRVQAPMQVAVDIAALAVLMHASGGVESGLGILLVPAVAGGALLLPQRQGLALAAFASVAVLGQHYLIALTDGLSLTGTTQAGLLGIGLFSTAVIGHLLAARARRSAMLAEQRRTDLEQLSRINAQVIRRMQTGVIVTEADGEVLVANPSAERLLGVTLGPATRLESAAPDLAGALEGWLTRQRRSGLATELPADAHQSYVPRFADLGAQSAGRVLIFLEDSAALRQQAQLLKLAGLGRLAASIAHQIRNPLAAIRQAASLLDEELASDQGTRELLEIIHRHGTRLGNIVDEVLALSRQQAQHQELLALEHWLVTWTVEYRQQRGLDAACIATLCDGPLTVRFDPGHLSQALGNLVDNALNHSSGESPRVRITARVDTATRRPAIEVTDRGPGVAPAQRAQLFEPFYTTRVDGTGIGLYVVRQLCEANQAQVDYFEPAGGGAGFRILCTDPRRRQYA